jgi:hypothetical protein
MASQQAECIGRAEPALMYVKGRSFLRVEEYGDCPADARRWRIGGKIENIGRCRWFRSPRGQGRAIRSASHHLAIIATCFTPTNT